MASQRHSESLSACGKLPLFPRTPISPAGGLPGYGRLPPPSPPPGTLPHPLENAARFPQPTGHDGERRRKEGAQMVDTGSTGNPRPLLPTWNRNSVGFLDLLGILSLLCQAVL